MFPTLLRRSGGRPLARPGGLLYIALLALLCLGLVLGMTGCGSRRSDPTPTVEPVPSTPTADDDETPERPVEEYRPRPALTHLGPFVHTERVHDLGRVEIVDPAPEDLVAIPGVGYAPVDQIWLFLRDGMGRAEAEDIASDWGATVVGEIEFLSAFQLQTRDATLDELLARVAEAEVRGEVELALPNLLVQVDPRTPLVEKCTHTVTPNYRLEGFTQPCRLSGIFPPSLSRPYEMIGLEDAWTMVSNAGLELHRVRVGVYDEAAWGATPEYNVTDGPRLGGLSEPSIGQVPTGSHLQRASHGTEVVHTLAADHRTGRSIGVASILGDHLSVLVNISGDDIPAYQLVTPPSDGEEEEASEAEDGEGEEEPEPGGEEGEEGEEEIDPTLLHTPSNSYIVRVLVRLKELIEAGNNIINVSMGPTLPQEGDDSHATLNVLVHEAFDRFVRWSLTHHEDVLFVVAAGNDGVPVMRVGEWFGQRLGNVMTVGGLDHRGHRVVFSNYMAEEDGEMSQLEVTLAAPAVGIVTHHDQRGYSVTSCGNSFASPMVAGAAAILRSLKPDLTAGQIKEILVAHGAAEVPSHDPEDDAMVSVPSSVGGRILRVDRAVLHVINLVRQEQGLSSLTAEELLNSHQLKVRVDGGVEAYEVVAWVEDFDPQEVEILLEVLCGRANPVSHPLQVIAGEEHASWSVTRREDAVAGAIEVRVTRLDTNACYLISLPAPKSEWDITACNRGSFGLGGFIGTETTTGVGDPDSPQYLTREPQDYPVGSLTHVPGRDPYPLLSWDGRKFSMFSSVEHVPEESTRMEPYPVARWVRGEISPDHERILWLEVGERHLARYSRPGKNLAIWTSDVYIKEWVWQAEDLPLVRSRQPEGFRVDVSRDDTLEEQGLVSAYYCAQSIWPYWPAQHHIDQGTSSFTVFDFTMRWPGANYAERSLLSIWFELAEDWWD